MKIIYISLGSSGNFGASEDKYLKNSFITGFTYFFLCLIVNIYMQINIKNNGRFIPMTYNIDSLLLNLID